MHFIMQTQEEGSEFSVWFWVWSVSPCNIRSATGCANVLAQVQQHLVTQPGSGLGGGGGTLSSMCLLGTSSNDCASECSFYSLCWGKNDI